MKGVNYGKQKTFKINTPEQNSILDKLRQEVIEFNKFRKEVIKILGDRNSIYTQISEAIEKATGVQTDIEKLFDLDDPMVKALREKMKQDE